MPTLMDDKLTDEVQTDKMAYTKWLIQRGARKAINKKLMS